MASRRDTEQFPEKGSERTPSRKDRRPERPACVSSDAAEALHSPSQQEASGREQKCVSHVGARGGARITRQGAPERQEHNTTPHKHNPPCTTASDPEATTDGAAIPAI